MPDDPEADSSEHLEKQLEQRASSAKHELWMAEQALDRAQESDKDSTALQERVNQARQELAVAEVALDELNIDGRIKEQARALADAEAASDSTHHDPDAWDRKNQAENELLRLKANRLFGCSLPLVAVFLAVGVILAILGIVILSTDDDGDESETTTTGPATETATENFSGHYEGTRVLVGGATPEPGVVNCDALSVILALDVVQTGSDVEVTITGGPTTGRVGHGSTLSAATGELSFEWTVENDYGVETWTGRFYSEAGSRKIDGAVTSTSPGCGGTITASG